MNKHRTIKTIGNEAGYSIYMKFENLFGRKFAGLICEKTYSKLSHMFIDLSDAIKYEISI